VDGEGLVASDPREEATPAVVDVVAGEVDDSKSLSKVEAGEAGADVIRAEGFASDRLDLAMMPLLLPISITLKAR
jgi:hypothetical protein